MGDRKYAWTLLGIVWFIVCCNQAFPNIGGSFLNAAMAKDLALDRKTLGSLFGVYMLLSGLPGALVGFLVTRFGVKATMVFGSALTVTGALAMALWVDSGTEAYFAYSTLVGLGVIVGGFIPAQTCLANWFVKRRALAFSVMYSATGVGGFIAARVLGQIVTTPGYDWRTGWLLIAALATLAAILTLFFVVERPADMEPGASAGVGRHKRPTGNSSFQTSDPWTFAEAIRTPTFWIIQACALGPGLGFHLYLGHGVVHLQDLGFSPTDAASSLSIVTATMLIGQLIVGSLGDRIDPRYIWSCGIVLFGIGMLLFLNVGPSSALFPFAICIGLAFGICVVCIFLVLANYFGPEALAGLTGIAFAVQVGFSALSPTIAGFMFDSFGTYIPSFYAVAAVCFAGALTLTLLKMPTNANAAKEAALVAER